MSACEPTSAIQLLHICQGPWPRWKVKKGNTRSYKFLSEHQIHAMPMASGGRKGPQNLRLPCNLQDKLGVQTRLPGMASLLYMIMSTLLACFTMSVLASQEDAARSCQERSRNVLDSPVGSSTSRGVVPPSERGVRCKAAAFVQANSSHPKADSSVFSWRPSHKTNESHGHPNLISRCSDQKHRHNFFDGLASCAKQVARGGVLALSWYRMLRHMLAMVSGFQRRTQL